MRASSLASRLYAFLPLLIGLLTLITVVVGLLGLHRMEAVLIASAGETLELAAAEIANKVDLVLDERARHVEALARTPLLRIEDQAALTRFLTQVRTTYPDYIWLGVMDVHGRVVAGTDPTTIGTDRSRSHSFQRVRATRALVWEDVKPVEGSAGMDGVGWAAPILDTQGGFFGVIAGYIGLPVFENIQTQTIELFATQHGFLSSIEYQFLTPDGQAFIDSDLHHKGHVNLKHLLLPSALLSESGSSGFVEEEHLRRHVPVITGYARTSSGYRSTRAGWSILIRADQNDVLTPIRSTMWKLILAGVFAYAPLLGFSLWAAWGLRREWVKARLERAHAEAAETKYRLLLESTGEGIYGLNRQGRCTFINKAAAAMLGYEPETLLGKDTHPIIHHSRADGSPYPSEDCPIYGAFTTGEACRVHDEVLWRRDGTSFPVVYTSHPILRYGVVMGAVVTFLDNTEVKRAEEALLRSERRTRAILENAIYAVVEVDTEGLILEWNPQAEIIFGWKRAEIIGRPLVETIIPPHLRDAHMRGFQRFLVSGEGPLLHRVIEVTALRRDGTELPVELRVSAFKESDKYVVNAFIADISERKLAEEALRRSEERLRRLLEEREQLSQDLHDNIIQSVFAVGLTLEEYKRRVSAETKNGGKELSQAIANLNQVITDVRGYIEAVPGAEVTVEQMQELLRRKARSLKGPDVPDFRIRLDRPALAQLTPDLAKQVLFIALEAMSNGARHSGGSRCDVILSEEQGHLLLAVRDDGVGFDVQAGSGHGLGLGNIAARVRKLGGRLRILSEPGKGAQILVDFAKEGHDERTQHDSQS